MIQQTKDMNGPARAAYMRSERIPLPMVEHTCFVTGKRIVDNDMARFTHEFDAWVSLAGQNLIEEWIDSGMKTQNPEWEIIYREWYANDAADADYENEHFRRWHK